MNYARKITKSEARIDWSADAGVIVRQIRAFDPVPGAYTEMNGQVLKIWKGRIVQNVDAEPGLIVDAIDDLVVSAGDGNGVALLELQRAGGRRMDARLFRAGHRITPGMRLGA